MLALEALLLRAIAPLLEGEARLLTSAASMLTGEAPLLSQAATELEVEGKELHAYSGLSGLGALLRAKWAAISFTASSSLPVRAWWVLRNW